MVGSGGASKDDQEGEGSRLPDQDDGLGHRVFYGLSVGWGLGRDLGIDQVGDGMRDAERAARIKAKVEEIKQGWSPKLRAKWVDLSPWSVVLDDHFDLEELKEIINAVRLLKRLFPEV